MKMKNTPSKIKHNPENIIKTIMKREKMVATKLAAEIGGSPQALRKRLRGDSKFSFDEFTNIIEYLGYNMMIVKKEDVV